MASAAPGMLPSYQGTSGPAPAAAPAGPQQPPFSQPLPLTPGSPPMPAGPQQPPVPTTMPPGLGLNPFPPGAFSGLRGAPPASTPSATQPSSSSLSSSGDLINRVMATIRKGREEQQAKKASDSRMELLRSLMSQGQSYGQMAMITGRPPGAPPVNLQVPNMMSTLFSQPRPPMGGGMSGGAGPYVVPGAMRAPAYPGAQMRRGGALRMMRGGYPMDYVQGFPGLPLRHFAAGDYVPGDGRGDGRSDHIDAKLSPGEFVMDAETVGLLGNGDNEAGARKLEQMRQNIRRQKGSALAKGRFSPDAKNPESYMR